MVDPVEIIEVNIQKNYKIVKVQFANPNKPVL